MSQKTVTTLVDDLTGDEGDDISTVEFGLDGIGYEIDLSDAHAKDLRGELEAYIAASRKLGKVTYGGTGRGRARATSTRSSGGGSGYSRDQMKHIRTWAKGEGYEISDRGRVPNHVVQAWETQHQGNGSHLAAVGS